MQRKQLRRLDIINSSRINFEQSLWVRKINENSTTMDNEKIGISTVV